MVKRASASLAAALLLACGEPVGPSVQPPERFGSVTALIDGRPWISSYALDSLVAAYDTISGQLQVLGYEFRAGFDPHIDLFVRTDAGVGAYHLGDFFAPAFGQWTTGLASGRPRASVERLRLFVSTGSSVDSLVIEELNLVSRRIRGRFNFAARVPHETTLVQLSGRFAGKIELYDGTEELLRR